MHLRINQDKARLLRLDSSTLASNLQAMISGTTVAEFREKDKTVGIVFRVDSQNRNDLSQLKNPKFGRFGSCKYSNYCTFCKCICGRQKSIDRRRNERTSGKTGQCIRIIGNAL